MSCIFKAAQTGGHAFRENPGREIADLLLLASSIANRWVAACLLLRRR
jgi:hypothetical protein